MLDESPTRLALLCRKEPFPPWRGRSPPNSLRVSRAWACSLAACGWCAKLPTKADATLYGASWHLDCVVLCKLFSRMFKLKQLEHEGVIPGRDRAWLTQPGSS